MNSVFFSYGAQLYAALKSERVLWVLVNLF
jgi:hypothetical protein